MHHQHVHLSLPCILCTYIHDKLAIMLIPSLCCLFVVVVVVVLLLLLLLMHHNHNNLGGEGANSAM